MDVPAPKKRISIVTSCFNEAGNLDELYRRIHGVFSGLPRYEWEMVIADNRSTDGSRDILRGLAAGDRRVKVVFNARNFGVIRSGHNALMRCSGDAAVLMCSDLQDPPEMIPAFIEAWERGNAVVCAVKAGRRGLSPMALARSVYYRMLEAISETPLLNDFYGFGLYSRSFLEALKRYREPYPYFRGLVGEIGLARAEIPFAQAKRGAGRSSYNFLSYYDTAMNGIVNHSRLPLRLAAFAGFLMAGGSLLVALAYFVVKLMFWDRFSLGLAPIMIGLFFFSSVQLIFIGILGEYLGAVWTQVKDRPHVIEEEVLNFD